MSDDKIIDFSGCTTLDIPPERVIRGAEQADLKCIIIIGETEDELYMATSMGRNADVIYLLEQAKHRLLSGDYDEVRDEHEI